MVLPAAPVTGRRAGFSGELDRSREELAAAQRALIEKDEAIAARNGIIDTARARRRPHGPTERTNSERLANPSHHHPTVPAPSDGQANDVLALLEDAIDNIDNPGSDAEEWIAKAKAHAATLAQWARPAPRDKPSLTDYREAYKASKQSGQAMSRALLEIWHLTEPSDTRHMTYGEDHDEVVRAVRKALEQTDLDAQSEPSRHLSTDATLQEMIDSPTIPEHLKPALRAEMTQRLREHPQ